MWVRALAIAILAALLAGPALVFSKALAAALLIGAAVALGWAFFEIVKPRLRYRDPYDLSELRRVHEEEKTLSEEPADTQDAPALVVCSRCFGQYDSRLRACPRCGAGA